MRKMLRARTLVVAFLLGGSAIAAEQTVNLSVGNMYCEVCSLLLDKKLSEVPGGSAVAVSYDEKTAVVTFDDERTNVEALASVCTELGYTTQVQTSPSK